MNYPSIIQSRGAVTFPEFTGERVYMVPFTIKDGLPTELKRWQPTVDAMMDGIDMPGVGYLMVDQSIALPGHAQRRPGLHIDGYWNPGLSAHGSGGLPNHNPAPEPTGGHDGFRRRRDGYHTPIYQRHDSVPPGHRPRQRGPGGHGSGSEYRRHSAGTDSWASATFAEPEAIILASNLSAAHGYLGEFSGPIGEMGDCQHVDISHMQVLPMGSHTVYAGNVCCLHESLPILAGGQRTLVRINAPGWSP